MIKEAEGKVTKDGLHICYDDTAPPKRDSTGEVLETPIYAGGVPTIGYGTIEGLNPADVGRLTITEKEATARLEEYLERHRPYLRSLGLEGDALTAIESFVYNLGRGALFGRTTRIAEHLKNGDYEKAAEGMRKWNKRRQNGKLITCPGLQARREKEICLLLGKTSSPTE